MVMFFLSAGLQFALILEEVEQMGDNPTGTHACGRRESAIDSGSDRENFPNFRKIRKIK